MKNALGPWQRYSTAYDQGSAENAGIICSSGNCQASVLVCRKGRPKADLFGGGVDGER